MKQMKYLFYNRQSSITQNSVRQIEAFKKIAPITKTNLFSDVCSGSIAFKRRDSAIRLWDEATSCSTPIIIVVKSIDRLGRNLKDILSTVDDFTSKGISIMFLKEGFSTLNTDGKVNSFGKIILAVMGSIAEAERERIRERQAEGIDIAQLNGVYAENGKKRLGKIESKSKFLTKHKDIQVKLSQGLSYREIRTLTGKSLATITKVSKSVKMK